MSSDKTGEKTHEFHVAADEAGVRLDLFLTDKLPNRSRSHLRRIIDAGCVTVDGKRQKPSFSLPAAVRVRIEVIEPPRRGPEPEDIPIDLLYEDDVLAVVNKPPGMVVHPGRGNWSGTLASALAFHFDTLSTTAGAIRPGIVHRLDRDTSGVLVVAKTDEVHVALASQFKARTVEKEYLAIVVGVPDRDRDWIDRPIAAHPTQREKKAIRDGHSTSRPAQSFYEVLERFDGFALVKVLPKTGRTHQIRLHLASIGCQVLCDRLYGGRSAIRLDELRPKRARARGGTGGRGPGTELPNAETLSDGTATRASPAKESAVLLARQALHARRLAFDHPATGARREFNAPLPEDLQATLNALRCKRATL